MSICLSLGQVATTYLFNLGIQLLGIISYSSHFSPFPILLLGSTNFILSHYPFCAHQSYFFHYANFCMSWIFVKIS